MYGIGFKGDNLVFYKIELYSGLAKLKVGLNVQGSSLLESKAMKKVILCGSVVLLCLATAVLAGGNDCNCSILACPQDNLSRGPVTTPLTHDRHNDGLSSDTRNEDLTHTRKVDDLSHDVEIDTLSSTKKPDDLEHKITIDDLSKTQHSDDLSHEETYDPLSH